MFHDQIVSGARAVVQVAAHFDELKPIALALRERGSATARGFFTPAEDEEVRHLLVSYWQARNALYELITSFRRNPFWSGEWHPAAFLVAYGAAAVLVDAARFLRETFDGNAIVRAKLNEPDAAFGVSAGVYDQVQHSLTSLRNAWHLFHAQRYFDEHAAVLRALAADEPLAGVWRVVERLEERVRVPAARYARAAGRVRAREFSTGVDQEVIGRAVYGLMKLSGTLVADRYTRPWHRPALPAEVCAELKEILQPGDVFITRKEYALTNYFLPGYWPHAALYLGRPEDLARLGLDEIEHVRPRLARMLATDGSEPRCVLEALRDGVWIRSLHSPLANDAIVVLRPQLTQAEIAAGLARGLLHESKPYDFGFDFTRSDRLVCTEVVYRSYDGVGGLRFDLTRRAGRMTLAAMDLLQMAVSRRGFEPVAAFAPAVQPNLATGPGVDGILRATGC